jgi:hypothetical protein
MKYAVLPVIFSSLLLPFSVYAQTNATTNIGDQLCSPQGVADLVPGFRGADGHFQVPNPKTDLPRFLQAYDGLRNVIDAALAQAQMNNTLSAIGSQSYQRLSFGPNWTAAEVWMEANGDQIPDFSKGGFGDYGGPSFMQNIKPVPGTGNTFYAVPDQGVFISPMPTVLRCVNVLMETSSHDSGTFISPSYALGTKDGKAFMTVNGCQNTTKIIKINGQEVMTPGASSYLGIQIATPYFKAEPLPAKKGG